MPAGQNLTTGHTPVSSPTQVTRGGKPDRINGKLRLEPCTTFDSMRTWPEDELCSKKKQDETACVVVLFAQLALCCLVWDCIVLCRVVLH